MKKIISMGVIMAILIITNIANVFAASGYSNHNYRIVCDIVHDQRSEHYVSQPGNSGPSGSAYIWYIQNGSRYAERVYGYGVGTWRATGSIGHGRIYKAFTSADGTTIYDHN